MSGGDEGDRTPDLSVANAALSHLSYIPGDTLSNQIKVFELKPKFSCVL